MSEEQRLYTIEEAARAAARQKLPQYPHLASLREKLSAKARREPNFKLFNLYGHVLQPETLECAYRVVRANDGAAGVDGVTFEDIENSEGMVIEPIFEEDFHECSYGFRPNRGAKDAVEKVAEEIKSGKPLVYDADLSSYFDTIPNEKLIACLRMRVVDNSVIALVRQWLKVCAREPGGVLVKPKGKGAPQGGVISPLLHFGPATKSVKKECRTVHEHTHARNCKVAVKTVIERLNKVLSGWARYFSVGYASRAFGKVNHYVLQRMARWLNRRSPRYYRLRYSSTYYGELQHLRLLRLRWADYRPARSAEVKFALFGIDRHYHPIGKIP